VITLRDAAVELGGHTIWSGVTLDIAAGEFVAILGPNGAGKSTLLRVLLGLLPVSAGSVAIFGQPPHRGNAAIGYVPQRRSLNPDLAVRGRDLVALGVDGYQWGFAPPWTKQHAKEERVRAALEKVDATSYVDLPIRQMSGGEQQRLLLAQALVGNPRLLLLDEPLASLDLRNQSAVAQLVARVARAQAQGTTVLLVAHDVNPLLPLVDRVIYVCRGQVAIGKPSEIITTERLSELYGALVEVVRDSRGRTFVVGLENEVAHTHIE
jgi:zinc/manganese transport system ATP-binding protein